MKCLILRINYEKEHKIGSILTFLSGRGNKDIDYVYETMTAAKDFLKSTKSKAILKADTN